MHKLANRVLLTDIRDAGLLQGDVGEMMEVSAIRFKLKVMQTYFCCHVALQSDQLDSSYSL